jgi:hypothetical protein
MSGILSAGLLSNKKLSGVIKPVDTIIYDPSSGLVPEASNPPWSMLSSYGTGTVSNGVLTVSSAGTIESARQYQILMGKVTRAIECTIEEEAISVSNQGVSLGIRDGERNVHMGWYSNGQVAYYNGSQIIIITNLETVNYHKLKFRKIDTLVEFYIDDVLVSTIPYSNFPVTTDRFFMFGNNYGATSVGKFKKVEVKMKWV